VHHGNAIVIIGGRAPGAPLDVLRIGSAGRNPTGDSPMNRPLLSLCAVLAFIATASVRAGEMPMAAPSAAVVTSAAVERAEAAARVAAPFAALAGSTANAEALATALKTGMAATLPTTPRQTSSTTSIVPPTKPMGWANVSHSLELAQFVLTDAGVVHPTTSDLSAALVGGVVVAPSGKTVALPGVLKQRAAGMAWSDIAQRYGTTMRAFNRGGTTPRATMSADSGRVH
jgi:hypothetical protein